MKGINSVLAALGMVLIAVPAMAVDTAKVYSSGILILVFIGICALVVLFQMIPAILLLLGMVKGMVNNLFKGKLVHQETAKK
jgi:hypothetical protein